MKKIIGLLIVISTIFTMIMTCFASEKTAEKLEDGVYLATFDTDSGMFHPNEACEGKGFLFVKDGVMTIHVALVSKQIVNLFNGLAEDAEELDEEELIQPSKDEITYSDGYTEKVHGFNVFVPQLNEEFDLALIGKKQKWYDHKVSVSDPQPIEIEGFDFDAENAEITYEFEGGGKITFEMELNA